MGLRRYERVQRSTRPHAKLGRGGGWNVGDDDARPSDAPAFPTPPKPGWGRAGAAAGEAENDGDVARDPAALASPHPAAVKPFSGGGGWRGAAPGFGDPEDRAPPPPPPPPTLDPRTFPEGPRRQPPDGRPPDAMRECLERHCEETLAAELRDVPGALVRPCASPSSAPRGPNSDATGSASTEGSRSWSGPPPRRRRRPRRRSISASSSPRARRRRAGGGS